MEKQRIRPMPGLSDEGCALVVEMLAHEAIDLDAMVASLDRMEGDAHASQ